MRTREWMALGVAGLACVLAVLLIGGAFRWAQAIVAVVVAAGLAIQVPSRRVLARISPLVVALGLAATWTALSLVPVPAGLRAALDPVGSTLRDDGGALLDLDTWAGITRDAPGSASALVFFVILLGVAVTTLRLAQGERGRARVSMIVGALCVTTGVIVGAHQLLGLTQLYGLYEVRAAKPTVLGPLLNENHLGCLMAFGTCITIGLAMFPRQSSRTRVFWMVGVLVCGATTAATSSRGALLALIAGVLTTGALLVSQRFVNPAARKPRGAFMTHSLPIGVVAISVVVVIVYASAGKVSGELQRTTLERLQTSGSKFAAWRSAKELVLESPWVGVGRGGFESSFTRVHPASGSVTFSHVENEYLQAVIDWGVPGAALVGFAAIWFAVVALRRWRDGPLTAGALGGLAAVALQSNVDFGVELLGVAVPVTMMAATVATVPLRESTGRALTILRALRAGHAVALLGGAALLISPFTMSIAEDHQRLGRPGVNDAEIREALERHPFDYLGYALAAQRAARAGQTDAVRLLNHAMRLHPTLPDLHRIAARMLLRIGYQDQAAFEYATAIRGSRDPDHLLGEVVATFPPERAALAIPIDYGNHEIILRGLVAQQREDVAISWLKRIVDSNPQDLRACNRLYELALATNNTRAAIIAGKACVELLPDHQTRSSLASLFLHEKQYGEVLHLLQDVDQWHGLIDNKFNAWLMVCDARIGLAQWDDAVLCLRHLDASSATREERRGDILLRLDEVSRGRAAAVAAKESGNAGSGTGSATHGTGSATHEAGGASPGR